MDQTQSDFERVYNEHVWRVYGFLAYRVRDTHLAEDLTQATFERALRGWSRFDPRKASEQTWLIAIARNLLIDNHRRRHEDLLAEVDDKLMPSVDAHEISGASHQVVSALEELSSRDREVIALRFGGDLTGPEIALILELSLGNVQQILSRSLRKLREFLDETDFRAKP